MRDAAEVWGWSEEEIAAMEGRPPRVPPVPKPPPGPCERCIHEEHIGVCGLDRIVQGITISCGCVTPTATSLDKPALARAVAAQEQMVAEAQASENRWRR